MHTARMCTLCPRALYALIVGAQTENPAIVYYCEWCDTIPAPKPTTPENTETP